MDNVFASDGEIHVPCLSDFQGEHARMQALFERYQCGLMALDLHEARNGLEGLKYELSIHMAVEDGVLMPLFEALPEHGPGASPDLFKAEHNKLLTLLGSFFDDLENLSELHRVGSFSRREALLVIERGFTFKHLFEHHTAREDRVFYPQITASLSLQERQGVWEQMDALEAQTRQSLGSPPTMGEVDF